MLRTILVVAALLASTTVHAHRQLPQDTAPATINTYASEPQETPDAFIQRIAPYLREYTIKHGVEVCGWLAADGSTYTLVVQTIGSKVSCVANQTVIGYTNTGQLVHTHPRAGIIKLDRNDRKRRGYALERTEPERWSPADLQYPGWLVTPTQVLYNQATAAVTPTNK